MNELQAIGILSLSLLGIPLGLLIRRLIGGPRG